MTKNHQAFTMDNLGDKARSIFTKFSECNNLDCHFSFSV